MTQTKTLAAEGACRTKRSQHNALDVKDIFHREETVTVVDPRHPLYGRRFALIGFANREPEGRCCIVSDQEPVKRYIPLAVTDRSLEPFGVYPLPLSLTSVRQLLATYQRIVSQSAGGTEDETVGPGTSGNSESERRRTVLSGEAPDPNTPGSNLGLVDSSTKASDVSDTGDSLRHAAGPAESQHSGEGGRP